MTRDLVMSPLLTGELSLEEERLVNLIVCCSSYVRLFVICFNAQSSVASSRSDFAGNEMGACNFLYSVVRSLYKTKNRNHLRDSTPYVTHIVPTHAV